MVVIVSTLTLSQHAYGQSNAAPNLKAQHREVLAAWLQKQPNFRLATEADCKNKTGLAATRDEYGLTYQPYYAAGDLNGDGREDFAVALIDRQKRSRRFAIAIFNGPHTTKTTATPSFLTTGFDLSDGGLVLRSGNPLIAGVFQSDDCVILRPRARTYVMKSCL
jgi:hypothetical protein